MRFFAHSFTTLCGLPPAFSSIFLRMASAPGATLPNLSSTKNSTSTPTVRPFGTLLFMRLTVAIRVSMCAAQVWRSEMESRVKHEMVALRRSCAKCDFTHTHTYGYRQTHEE